MYAPRRASLMMPDHRRRPIHYRWGSLSSDGKSKCKGEQYSHHHLPWSRIYQTQSGHMQRCRPVACQPTHSHALQICLFVLLADPTAAYMAAPLPSLRRGAPGCSPSPNIPLPPPPPSNLSRSPPEAEKKTHIIPVQHTLRQHANLTKHLFLPRARLEDFIKHERADLLPLFTHGRFRLGRERDLALAGLGSEALGAVGDVGVALGVGLFVCYSASAVNSDADSPDASAWWSDLSIAAASSGEYWGDAHNTADFCIRAARGLSPVFLHCPPAAFQGILLAQFAPDKHPPAIARLPLFFFQNRVLAKTSLTQRRPHTRKHPDIPLQLLHLIVQLPPHALGIPEILFHLGHPRISLFFHLLNAR